MMKMMSFSIRLKKRVAPHNTGFIRDHCRQADATNQRFYLTMRAAMMFPSLESLRDPPCMCVCVCVCVCVCA